MNDFYAGLFGGVLGTLLSHPIDTARILVQTKNPIRIKHLVKGISPPLVGVGIEKSIVFGTFYSMENTNISTFNKGLISGLLSTVIVSPMEKLKIQLQTREIQKIAQLKNIYAGWAATMIREVPGYGIYFSCYENIRKKDDTSLQTFYKGGLSGCAAWSVIYPADYVKTLVQNSNITYKNAFNIISKNPFQIYNGIHYALLRCFPLHGGVFLGYKFISEKS